MEFTLLLWGSPDGESALPSEDRRAIVERHIAFSRKLRDEGAHVYAAPLNDAAAGRVVRKDLVTDGPFAETKEQLGGLYVIRCESLDEAVEWAKQVPGSPGLVVEVRANPEV
jgi:hypothetical protein